MKIFSSSPEDIYKAFIDYWTAIHWASGTVAKSVFGLTQKQCVVLAVLWEIFENSSFGAKYWKFLGEDYTGDSTYNIITDIAAVAIGYSSVYI